MSQYSKKAAEKAKQNIKKKVKKVSKSSLSIIAKVFLPAIAILLVLLILIILLFTTCSGMSSSVVKSSSWVLGTYNAQDKYLSKSEEYYTKLANQFNTRLLMVGDTNAWRYGLVSLGASNVSSMKDAVDTWVYGKSTHFNYDPADYDYDSEKLLSFLCAYFYAKDGDGNTMYWTYDSKVEDVLEELFESEYEFEYYYDNTSHWERLNTYTYDGSLHYTTGCNWAKVNGTVYDMVTFSGTQSAISKYMNGKTLYYNLNNGEIVNYKDDCSATGWYLVDQHYDVTDPNGNTIAASYTRNTSYYSTTYSDGYGISYSVGGTELWVYQHYHSTDLPNGTDLMDTFQSVVTPQDFAVKWYIENAGNFSSDERSEFVNMIINYGHAGGGSITHTDWLNFSITQNWSNTSYSSWYDRILAFEETSTNFGYTDGNGDWQPYGYAQYYQQYEWVTDVTLYYNVKQKKTFDEAIEDMLLSLPDGADRLTTYEAFLGVSAASGTSTTRGNHQTFTCPLSGSIEDYIANGSILNAYGYDVQEWNTVHCAAVNGSSHQAIDISCGSGTPVYAGLSGKVDSTDSNSVVLRLNDCSYWYDGDGYGKTRDTKIYYYNITSTVSKRDTVNEGDIIGYVNDSKKCVSIDNSGVSTYLHVAIEIDTDGVGWSYIDPLLLFW